MSEPYVQVTAGTVLVADHAGQVRPPGAEAHAVGRATGLHVRGCRVLSTWLLQVDGEAPLRAGGWHDASTRRCVLLPRTARNADPGLWLVRDQRLLAGGLVERLAVRDLSGRDRRVTLSIDAAADFADQFTLRGDGRAHPAAPAPEAAVERGTLRWRWHWAVDGREVAREVAVSATPAPAIEARADGHRLTWELDLPADGELVVSVRVGDREVAAGPEPSGGRPPAGPDLAAAARALRDASTRDLEGLLMPAPHVPAARIPAAGPPWFMILAGRDGLLTGLLAERSHPGLLPGVVEALAATQGRRDDPRRQERPGKIVHELRSGPLADLDVVPYGRYYGSVDATPLFLLALGRLADRASTTDRALLRGLEPAARAAVSWVRGAGGLDRTGFVVYTPDEGGLLNHGWKDSADAVPFPDGRLAAGPIALAEVQAYTWSGLRAAARCARDVWGDPAWAEQLDSAATGLRERFHDRFWLAEAGFCALALDGTGTPVRTLASNAGHALWTGILDPDAARAVAQRLASDDFFSGWALRTVARSEGVYEPLSYHRGSCWPHDTALAMLGMARYGLRDEARRLAAGIVRAGVAFEGRLPELFAGFGDDEFETPVAAAYAARPQAWSAAAGLAAADLLG